MLTSLHIELNMSVLPVGVSLKLSKKRKKLHYTVLVVITNEELNDDNHKDIVNYYSDCGLLENMVFQEVKNNQFNRICDILGEV